MRVRFASTTSTLDAVYQDGYRDVWAGLLREPYRLDSPFGGADFALLLVTSDQVSPVEQVTIAADFLSQGCRYAVCVGLDCEAWEDAFDEAHMQAARDVPASATPPLMTTSHPEDSLSEIASFFAQLTVYDQFIPRHFMIVVLGTDELALARYRAAVVQEFRRGG
jgi:hypothetical protein